MWRSDGKDPGGAGGEGLRVGLIKVNYINA